MNTSSNVWLVTGSGSGLGRNIAEAVLAAGHRLVATARDPRRLEDLVNKYGDQIRTAALDVTDEKAAQASVQMAVDVFGHLDVVVNNAGYGDIAPFEQLSAERFKALMDTNFYGVVHVTRAALPIMRQQQSGTILLIVPHCSMSPEFLKLLKKGHENASPGTRANPLLASICAL